MESRSLVGGGGGSGAVPRLFMRSAYATPRPFSISEVTLQEQGCRQGGERCLSKTYLACMTHATLKDEKMSK